MENGNISIDGRIRPFNEQFDFTANTWNPVLEGARYLGKLLAGPGTPFEIVFVGDQGLLVSGTYQFQVIRYARSSPSGHFHLIPIDHCFLAGTQISMWDGTKTPIEQVEAGDIVVSYDKDGTVKPGRVKRTMTTRAKLILDVHGLMVTPGHAKFSVPWRDLCRRARRLASPDPCSTRGAAGLAPVAM